MIRKAHFALLLAFFLLSDNIKAQNFLLDSLKAKEHHHTTPWEILSGEGDENFVCYKQAHRNVYFIITGLIIIIAAIAIKLLLLNSKTNRILKSKNTNIQQPTQNKPHSINYAKRLQNAILPSAETVNAALPENFVLYQPKDIVSGDFYWVSSHGNKSLVAAIDCTGHGVPGALLSIVGHNAINQTVNELNIIQPAKVLDSMNSIIKKILHQDKGSDIRDGMDMALCCIDKETLVLEYSGASNPLYIVSEGELQIIKASKLTVGSLQEDVKEKPANHSIQLNKGDCFYIFSDGYADQFGGNDNKKFKTSRMQELLISIFQKPMHEQKNLFYEAFNNWKDTNEQVDDVLVIGVRV